MRGLRRPAKRAIVRKLVRLHKVDLLCLQETKIHKDVENIVFDVWGSRRCGWEWVLLEGVAGGLLVIWNENVLWREDVVSSTRALAIKFHSVVNFLWAAADIFGPYEDSDKRAFWDLLSSVRNKWDVPWCLPV